MTLLQAMTQALHEVGCPPDRVDFMAGVFAKRFAPGLINQELTDDQAQQAIADTKRGWMAAQMHHQSRN